MALTSRERLPERRRHQETSPETSDFRRLSQPAEVSPEVLLKKREEWAKENAENGHSSRRFTWVQQANLPAQHPDL